MVIFGIPEFTSLAVGFRFNNQSIENNDDAIYRQRSKLGSRINLTKRYSVFSGSKYILGPEVTALEERLSAIPARSTA